MMIANYQRWLDTAGRYDQHIGRMMVESDYPICVWFIDWVLRKELFMNLHEYQKLAMRTCSIPYEDTGAMLNHAVFGLTSEAGEVSGILQKVYQGHDADPEHMKKELGDCLWMIAEACTALGFDLDDVAKTNIEKLQKRYPEGFDAEHSLHRAKGDI